MHDKDQTKKDHVQLSQYFTKKIMTMNLIKQLKRRTWLFRAMDALIVSTRGSDRLIFIDTAINVEIK